MKTKVENLLSRGVDEDEFLVILKKGHDVVKELIDPEAFADYIATKVVDTSDDKDDEIATILYDDFVATEAAALPMEEQIKLIDEDLLICILDKLNDDYCMEEGLCVECREHLGYIPSTFYEPEEWFCPNGCM